MSAIQQPQALVLQNSPALSFEQTSLVDYLNHIFKEAVKRRASDIHFEPYDTYYRIRCRVDGVLHSIDTPPASLGPKLSARIKILAGLDIAERRLPQDGRFKFNTLINCNMDGRVSTCPTLFGEKIVIRLLSSNNAHLLPDELGLTLLQKSQLIEAIQKPQGMILMTGPTGCGKSTSLYAALHALNDETRNIITIEDPVEINVAGINQVHINPKTGLTFAKALRAFLRQDPDIIMVGEIRDLETAEIAMHAAQTGHLVFSTLHTKSAVETLNRLIYMGIPPYHIADAIHLIATQRLVRTLCNYCKIPDETPHDLRQSFSKPAELSQAVGCAHCIDGYYGQTGIFELLPVSGSISQNILSGASAADIFKQAQKEGMQTLYQAGIEKVFSGVTTFAELTRVVADVPHANNNHAK